MHGMEVGTILKPCSLRVGGSGGLTSPQGGPTLSHSSTCHMTCSTGKTQLPKSNMFVCACWWLSACGCAEAVGVVDREMGMAAGKGKGSPRGFQGKADLHSVYRTSCPPSLLRLRSTRALHVIVDCDFEVTEVCGKRILAQASSKQRLQAWPSSRCSLVTGSCWQQMAELEMRREGGPKTQPVP